MNRIKQLEMALADLREDLENNGEVFNSDQARIDFITAILEQERTHDEDHMKLEAEVSRLNALIADEREWRLIFKRGER